jgi:quinol monooxygenase YgiN
MAIYQTATYQITPQGVAQVQHAIEEFVRYVQTNEPGTHLYAAWQQQDDPTQLVHLFIFEDEAAQTIHSQSDAVRRFESIYTPELVEGSWSSPSFIRSRLTVSDRL